MTSATDATSLEELRRRYARAAVEVHRRAPAGRVTMALVWQTSQTCW